ncbi:molybdopterin biosynthesis protein MoeE [ANME-1 cluster archaeon AG-394-G21]|nr:molybdopterin biosynthesis protein MoeE [ANME-1 cluster archaeon AG-394-G21]
MITEQEISIDGAVRAMKESDIGAIVTFIGVVRVEEGLNGMEVEVKDNAQAELEQLKREAVDKFDIEAVEIIHRHGVLELGDIIVAILVGAKHRTDAFRACEYLIDLLRINEAISLKELR